MKKQLHYLLLLCMFSSITQALTAAENPRKEIRRELQTYVQQNVMPVLKEHRLLLDKQMTSADKRQVEQLRQELKMLQRQQAQFRKEAPRHRSDLTDEQRAQLKLQRETRNRIFTAAGALASKYRPQLERINKALAPHKTTWETDLKAIADKLNPETEGPAPYRRPHHFGRIMQFRQLMRPVQFILWDVAALTAPGSLETENSTAVFPNPSSSSNTIAYMVEQAGAVKITLLNDKGTSLRVLLHERKTTGAHTFDVNAQNLPNGIFFYKIETASGVETLRFLKQ